MEEVKKQKKSLIVLGICLAIILLAVFLCSIVQTSGYSVKVTDLRNKKNSGTISLQATDKAEAANYTVSGAVVSGILMVPKNATAKTPAPAVVLTHGLYNNREMQLQNGIELSRRGFVVLLIDREAHGHNEAQTYAHYGQSMLDAAKYLYNMKYVDKDKIGVSGHSMGGQATNNSLAIDGIDTARFTITKNSEKVTIDAGQTHAALSAGYHMGIISAGLVQANNASLASYGSNLLGVGNIKASSDEFFYSNTQKTEVYVPVNKDSVTEDNYTKYYLKDGDTYVKQTDTDRYRKNAQYYNFTKTGNSTMYLTSQQAMQFVGKTADVASSDPWEVVNGGIYNASNGELLAQPDGNKRASVALKGQQLSSNVIQIRAIYEAKETHPMNHFSTKSAGNVTDFFYNVFGVPEGKNYINPANQSWWLKEMFSLLGFLGLFGMLFPILDMLLSTRLFASLKGAPAEAPLLLTKPRKHVSYWLGGILTAWFGAYSIKHLTEWYTLTGFNKLFVASEGYIYANVGQIAFWGICCALFALVMTALIWVINRVINVFVYKENYFQYDEHPLAGFQIRSFWNVLKTPLLAVILVGIFYGTVQLIWDWTVVDFRIWTFDIRVFSFARLATFMKYAVIFFIYYVVLAAFSQNYRVKDLPEWATIAINVVFNVIGIMILFAVQNSYFINTGALIDAGNKLFFIACYPIIPCVAIATVVSRRMYVRTGNGWLAGIVNALIMTFIACANTSLVGGGAVSWVY